MAQARRTLGDLLASRLNKLLGRSGYALVRHPSTPPDIDALAASLIAYVRPFTALSPERIIAFRDAVVYVERFGIEGAIVECGVWRGGAIMAAAKTLINLGTTGREIYLFDTFEGMTPPEDLDTDLHGRDAASQFEIIRMAASLDEVTRNVGSTGYPSDRVHYVKGRVEDTLPERAPDRIAILRLDTDFYESTRVEFEHLVPRLVPNGVLIIDDYGHWMGARRATDEFLAATNRPILLARTDYTGRMAVVPGS